MIITIDGPSGTGKSTVAREVARKLKFTFFDTGAMYRALTWAIMHEKTKVEDEKAVDELLDRFDFRIEGPDNSKRYFVGPNEVTEEIRTREVTAMVSAVSAIATVRKKLSGIQKKFAEKANAVFEGRDMGSVVFPHADLKIFLTARPEIRAERRFKQLIEKSPHCTYEEILRDILSRDVADSTRAISPLVKPEGSFEIDTSDLTVDEVVEEILKKVKI